MLVIPAKPNFRDKRMTEKITNYHDNSLS